MQQVFCFACETNLLQYFLLASLNSLQFFSVLQKLCYTSSHMQFLTVSFFKNRVWAGGGGWRKGVKAIFFLFFLFCDHFTIKVAKRQFFEKMSLDHEVPGCFICKILAKRLGAHQEGVLNQVGHILL